MIKILYATDTYREAAEHMDKICDFLSKENMSFQREEKGLAIKTKNAIVVFVPVFGDHLGLYQRTAFDYYILTGEAKNNDSPWNGVYMSRTSEKSKELINDEELLRLIGALSI